MYKNSKLFWLFLPALSFGISSLTAGSASPKTAAKPKPGVTAAVRPGESEEKLKSLLVAYGYHNLSEDGALVDFDQAELEKLAESGREDIYVGGRKYLAVYFHADGAGSCAWGEDTIIALYDRKPKLHLVDAANVQGDRETYVDHKLTVSPCDDLIVTSCAHLSAGEDHWFISLYSLVKGKITQVDRSLPVLYSPRIGNLGVSRSHKMSVIKDSSVKKCKKSKKGKILFNIREEEIRYGEDSDEIKSRQVHNYPLVLYPRGDFYVLSPRNPVLARFRAHSKALGIEDN